jgi:hypothetical protein
MQRIAGPGAIDGLFVEEDTGTGQPPTQITAAWMNAVQEELCTVVTEAGLTLDGGDNTQLLAAIAALVTAGSTGGRVVPVGSIVAWSGAISAIPAHWALCDGSGGTPDLRNRFIVGAGDSYAVSAVGGSKDAIVVTHSHNVNDHNHGISDTGHSHGIDVYDLDTGGSHSADASGSIANTGATTASAETGISIDDKTGLTTQDTGSSGVNANLPPYYALAYIMLIS